MTRAVNIVLTGFMGTGKSTVGKKAADRLNLTFVDIDKIIELRTQKTISSIFSDYGEKYFRSIEKETIREFSQKEGQVISTGGGVVLDPENMQNLKSKGLVILLKARPEIIYRNVCKDTSRPLLQSEDPMGKIKELLEIRREYYKDNHFEIDISDLTIEEVTDRVMEIYNSNS